jgi:hypothetical protein
VFVGFCSLFLDNSNKFTFFLEGVFILYAI